MPLISREEVSFTFKPSFSNSSLALTTSSDAWMSSIKESQSSAAAVALTMVIKRRQPIWSQLPTYLSSNSPPYARRASSVSREVAAIFRVPVTHSTMPSKCDPIKESLRSRRPSVISLVKKEQEEGRSWQIPISTRHLASGGRCTYRRLETREPSSMLMIVTSTQHL